MKALICSEYGPPESLDVGEFQAPEAGENDVLVRVEAAGLTFVDTLMIQDKHQNKHPLPFVPGMEVVGTVAEDAGPWKRGQRVAGLTYDGGLAETAKCDITQTFALPADVDAVTVAGSLSVYLTADIALRERGHIATDETVLVLGAGGGTGNAAVDVAASLGANVIACASSDEKLAAATAAGAAHTIRYDHEGGGSGLKSAIAGIAPDGVDIVFDPVAGDLAADASASVAWGGRYLIIGFAGGAIPQFAANRLLVKNRSAVGMALMYYRTYRPDILTNSADRLFEGIRTGNLKPNVTAVASLEDVPGLMREIMERRAVGKYAVRF